MVTPHRFSDEHTPIQSLRDLNDDEHLRGLLAIGDGFVATFELPDAATVVVGRSADCDICIDVPNVSRRHVLIHAGVETTIEDLGSANGTYVGGRRLERGESVVLGPDAVVELGSTMLVLQSRYRASRPRRIWVHDYFEARLEEECHRAARANRTFALLRIRTGSPQSTARALQELMLGALRSCDVVASYAPNDYEVLIADASAAESRSVVARVRTALSSAGAHVQTGVAYYPQDGRVPEALMARAGTDLTAPGDSDSTEMPVVVAAPAMRELHRLVERVAAGEINTLVLGETGTGKEVIAERIHALSRRVDCPLLRINCAALADNLLESELFGHERGAFTGATDAKPGLLEIADGGTVFLDEIGDMSLALQAKLLRTLEDGNVRRVGGLTSRPVDIRIVAATHKDLELEVAEGRFRRDLFFRIAGVTVVVPPLRDRVEEIEPLAEMFAAQACRRQRHQPPVTISRGALAWLQEYDWPGNIRELRNVMDRAVLLCTGGTIDIEHLPSSRIGRTYRLTRPTQPIARPVETDLEPPSERGERAQTIIEPIDLKAGMKERERELVRDALARAAGNQTQAARLLGISRRTLISRIEEFDLPRPRKRGKADN